MTSDLAATAVPRLTPDRVSEHTHDPPWTVHRNRLMRRLSTASVSSRLLLLLAPAGYGKTTGLRQWARQDPRPFAWLRADERSDDPRHLLRAIALALHRTGTYQDDAWRILTSVGRLPVDATVLRLATALRAHGSTVLVVDDAHRVSTQTSVDILSSIAAETHRGCLVLAGHRSPQPDVERMRGQGACVELGTDELAMTEREAAQLLTMARCAASRSDVPALLRETEGWPLALYLATVASRRHPAASASGRLTADNRFVRDYVRERILARQPAELVDVLLRSAVLDRMSGPVCDAVLERTGSAAVLDRAHRAGLFLVPLDARGEWFRLHRLFRAVLLSELDARAPGERAVLHRRAAGWHEEHDLPEQAVRHATAAGDEPTAARLITGYTQRFTDSGRIELVRDWLDSLDEGCLARNPHLAVMAVWIRGLTGDATGAQRALYVAESRSFTGTMPDGSTSFTSALARARAVLAPHGATAMRDDARHAVDLEPPGSRWHTMASLLHGGACLLTGSPDEAAREFARAAHHGRDGQRPGAAFALAQQALLAADQDDWYLASSCAAESRELVTAVSQLPALATHLAGARVALHGGDQQSARRDVERALELYRDPSPVAFPWFAAQAATLLGQLLSELGAPEEARARAGEAGRYLELLGGEGPLREQHRRLVARLDGSSRGPSPSVATGRYSTRLTQAELTVLHLLTTHLPLDEIAQSLHVSRNTVKSQVAAIYRKLQSGTRSEAVRTARRLGMLDGRSPAES